MKYIILDLEWNTALDRNSGKFVNEIIQIGAIKLNDKLKEIDRFSCMVVSRLTKKLSGRFKNLTGISNEDMLSGLPFEEAAKLYTKWAGNAVTMTWSNSDVYTLYDNFHTLLGMENVPCLSKYVDLQKYSQAIFLKNGFDINNQISLSTAADMLGIEYDPSELHRAIDDCDLGAKIFTRVYDKKFFKEFIVDTSRKDYYKKLMFRPYIICDINSPKINRAAMNFKCEKCGRRATKTSSWRFKGRSFRADFVCEKCNDSFIGCVSFKNNYDNVTVKKYKVRAKQTATVGK